VIARKAIRRSELHAASGDAIGCSVHPFTSVPRDAKCNLPFFAEFAVIMPTADAIQQEIYRVLRFGAVGFGGFFVDSAILALMTGAIHANPFVGRAVSVPIAIVFTFVCNRYWSFASAKKLAIGRSFASYVSTQGVGLICNLTVYSAALLVISSPLGALVIASAAAMIVNYLGARLWAFQS
jgi:putative flippase GtrA